MKKYLLEHSERLSVKEYAGIIADAHVSLAKKSELLEMLQNDLKTSEDFDIVHSCLSFLDKTIDSLNNTDNTQIALIISLMSYDDEKNGSDCIDGTYFAESWEDAQNAINEYLADDNDCGRDSFYWKIEQYSRNGEKDYSGFMLPKYIYFANFNGEIQYFSNGCSSRAVPCVWAEPFSGSIYLPLNLLVPYQPGDILQNRLSSLWLRLSVLPIDRGER